MSNYNHDTVTPYNTEEDKKSQVTKMFDGIAGKYDFLNHFLSLGVDIIWRKIALNKLSHNNNAHILDLATGTGDLAIEACKRLKPNSVMAVDISQNMLNIGIEKSKKHNLDHIITFEKGDSEKLRFQENSFNTVMASFGVRNFENLEKGLAEMYRVLKPEGTVMILEFSTPRIFPIKQLYSFYFKYILPSIGKLISKDNKAYTYLYESSSTFPSFENFISILNKIGFKNSRYYSLSFGICCIYIGKK
ncbi:MAG: bifunctional demethylmenaquinone methyltransferase/2-methoxy-6-polyprenyl,4-benzoquinol methylase [Bacteroidota bacterium]|jgi:demethylmenaquinone methyltransferase/2-methoxy-6-polyprenyl-1,4-benzoquinol methylase